MKRNTVLFDLGGVVLGSPLQAIRDYEGTLGLDRNAINRVAANTAPTGAWSRLERGELEMEAFYDAFERDCSAAGLSIDARDMMLLVAAATDPRPVMLTAISRLREEGIRIGALTNNWAQTPEGETTDATRALRENFDVFIESSVVGLRKPDPAIYHLACDRLEASPEQIVFLDDIGFNLKPARAMGMATIKVEEPESAVTELETILGLRLMNASG